MARGSSLSNGLLLLFFPSHLAVTMFSGFVLGSLSALLITIIGITTAAQVNRTIDDTLGDSVTGERPTYLSSNSGNWEDATCKGCAAQPDPYRAFAGTWTAATYAPVPLSPSSIWIDLSFTGKRFLR
jgi:hypothetical protein